MKSFPIFLLRLMNAFCFRATFFIYLSHSELHYLVHIWLTYSVHSLKIWIIPNSSMYPCQCQEQCLSHNRCTLNIELVLKAENTVSTVIVNFVLAWCSLYSILYQIHWLFSKASGWLGGGQSTWVTRFPFQNDTGCLQGSLSLHHRLV